MLPEVILRDMDLGTIAQAYKFVVSYIYITGFYYRLAFPSPPTDLTIVPDFEDNILVVMKGAEAGGSSGGRSCY